MAHATSIDPTLESRFAEAVAHHRAGRLDAAAEGYAEIMRHAPEHAPAWSMQGTLELQRGRAQQAVALLQRAAELDPASAGTQLNLGNALRGVDRVDDAIAAYERAIALASDLAIAHNNLANALRQRGRHDEAAASYRRALALDPASFPAAANLAHVLVADDAASTGDRLAACDRALALADAAGLRGPDVANVHNARGNLLLAAERLDEAIAAYTRAVELDPDFGQAQVNLGRAYIQAEMFDEAIASLRSGVARMPHERGGYKTLALMLRRLGRDAEAVEVYRAWLENIPDDPIAAHMVHAGSSAPPERSADAYVVREFDDFAASFDRTLARLQYRAPQLLAEALDRSSLAARRDLHVLDAGCGTGLCAPLLRDRAARLVGVDLSPKMLELARDRGGYDELVEGDLVVALRRGPAGFDLVVAADVLIYFGRLDEVLAALRDTLRPRGLVLFTLERGVDDERGWQLGAGGRYAHGREHLRRTLRHVGLAVEQLDEAELRIERDAAVAGWVVTARR